MLKFGAVSWDYKATPEEFQKKLELSSLQWNEIADSFDSNGHVLLVTCNRVEFYFTFDTEKIDHEQLSKVYPGLFVGHDAIYHLFRVSSGLESMSVGENEILSQIKSAYENARKAGKADKLISLIFRKAISVGKTVREKTSISRGKTSIPVIAVDLASEHVDLKSSRVCIVGTGQMAETFIKYVMKKEPGEITIVGRNTDRARQLAIQYGCSYAGMGDLPGAVNSADMVFTATSSRNVLVNRQMIRKENWPKTFVDISNPRNIDPGISAMPGVKVYGLDDIQKISLSNSELKKEEIPKAENVVKEEFVKFQLKLSEYRADELLTKSYTFAESIALMEISRMMKEINKGMDPGEAKRRSASAMANRILGNYTAELKKAAVNGDTELIAKLQAIFQ